MKTEQIFCDICGNKGARTIKKDQIIPTLNANVSRNDKVFLLDKDFVPMIALNYSKKKVHEPGSVEDIDLCHSCTNDLENLIHNATIAMIRKREEKKKKKSSKG